MITKSHAFSLRWLSLVATMTFGSMAFAVVPVTPVSITNEFGVDGYDYGYTLQVTSAPETTGTAWVHDGKMYVQEGKEYTFKLTCTEADKWYIGIQPTKDDGSTLDYDKRNGSQSGAGPNTTYIYITKAFTTAGTHVIAKAFYYEGDSFSRLRMTTVDIEVNIIKVDLDVDSDNDNGHRSPDQTEEEDVVEETAPGKIIIINADDDDGGGEPDCEDDHSNGSPDLDKDMAEMVAKVSSDWDSSEIDVFLKCSNYELVRVFKADGTLLLGPEDGHSEPYEILPSDMTDGVLDLRVEGIMDGYLTITLVYQTSGGTEIARDEVAVTVDHILDVPYRWQHKDTKLLCLYCERDGDHPWDDTHPLPFGEVTCEHCKWYCMRASTAMVGAYYGGNASQDRISYEVFAGESYNQLGHGLGMSYADAECGTTWAWGVSGVEWDSSPSWEEVVGYIVSYRPVIVVLEKDDGSQHAAVICGFKVEGGNRQVYVQNPSSWGAWVDWNSWPSGYGPIRLLVCPDNDPTGRIQESSITDDRDFHEGVEKLDGVMSFDEDWRFNGVIPSLNISPDLWDTDNDGINDKDEASALFGPIP